MRLSLHHLERFVHRSYTVILAPPFKTGQRLAISTAALGESALIIEYPLAIAQFLKTGNQVGFADVT